MGLSGGNRKAFFLEEEVIRRYRRWLVGTVAVGLGILLAISGAEAQQKAVNLTWTAGPVGDGWYLLLSLTSLLSPATRRSPQDRSSFLDSLAAGSAGAACGYIVWHAECLNFRPAAVLLVFPAGGLELLGLRLGLAGGTFAWARSPRSAS
jgi:hypothetical protein